MTTLTVRIPDELAEILDKVARHEERSKAWFVKKALKNFLEDFLKDGKNYSMAEVMKEAGITREDLDRATFDFSDCD